MRFLRSWPVSGVVDRDAVDLATALLAGPLDGFVVYHDRLAEAARAAGMTVAQPGR